MINGKNFFDQPIKNNEITYDNIRKIATGQGDDYTTGCLLATIFEISFISSFEIIKVVIPEPSIFFLILEKRCLVQEQQP